MARTPAETFIRSLTIFNKAKSRLAFFEPSQIQLDLLKYLEEGNKRIIVVKARQLGISTLVRSWYFYQWYIADEPVKLGVICHTSEAAMNLHNTDKTFLANLPKGLQPSLDRDTTKTIRCKKTGAELKAFTASASGGTRSYVLSAAHLSELPFYENPEELLSTILATVGDGALIIESSPNMAGDYFHKLVEDGLAGKNEWTVLFYPWTASEEYVSKDYITNLTLEERELQKAGLTIAQLSWRRKQVATLGLDRFIREYPRTIEEAFRSGATTPYFNPTSLKEITVLNLGDGEERIYPHEYCRGDAYIIGCDVSAGVGHDYSAMTVVHIRTMQPVYHFLSNRITPKAFTEKIIAIGNRYGKATVIVEGNSYGASVIEDLNYFKYNNVWKNLEGKHYLTTGMSRPLLFNHMKELIEGGLFVSLDRELYNQIQSCVWISNRPDHAQGNNDDLLFSTMLAYWGVKGKEGWRVTSINPIDMWKAKKKGKLATRAIAFTPTGSKRRPY